MSQRYRLALVLLGAACAPLATGCGVSEKGLGSPDAAVHEVTGEAGEQQDASPSFQDDATSGADGADDAAGATTDGPAQADAAQDDAAGESGAIVSSEGGVEGGVEAGAEAGADGGPAGEAGTGGTDSGTRDGAPVEGGSDASPADAGTACNFNGVWGSRIVIDVRWSPQGITGIVLASGSGTITQWLMSTLSLSGTAATLSTVVCGIDLPDFDGTAIAGGEVYGIRFPDSLFDNAYIPAFTISGTLTGASPGATLTTSAAAVLLGLTLPSPTTDPWPATITTEVDMDMDGKPGVMAGALQGNGYTYPPLDIFESTRADRLYLAIRQVTALSATATDCNDMTGTVSIPSITSGGTSKPAIDSHILGCRVAGGTTDCSSSQTSFIDNTQPVFTPTGTSSFTSLRMASGSTCAQVRQSLQ